MPALWKLALWSCGVSAAIAYAAPSPARACGGTFCDGANGMPVNQTGENILFAIDGGFVEAHVQISYEGGDAAQFSWIVPVPEIPEVDVGSLRLIENLRAATVPTYGFTTTTDCEDSSASGIGFITAPDGGGVSHEDPQVVELSTVGAFDFVVLQGGTAESLMQWLADNGYAPNPLAPALFESYLDQGSVFVAFKLNHRAGIEDLHPVVIRYPGDEPCIPIRLTAVAAREDMDIRAFFLGSERVLPTNYKHVGINRTQLDWLQRAPNYGAVVAKALDEAGGRAFMTEYAGTTGLVATDSLDSGALDPTAFQKIDPLSVVDVLVSQGLMSCAESCSYGHELVPLLLREFLPPPAGVDADAFYACPQCYSRLADTSAWDATAFEARFREYITDPMDHATDLLVTWPYLTRLYTRLSPDEMTEDPMFAEVEGLADVPNRLGAQRTLECCGSVMELPGGREVAVEGVWPQWDSQMPFATRIQQYQPGGPPATEVDNGPLIDRIVAAHNASVACAESSTGEETSGSESDTAPDDPDTTGVGSGNPATSSTPGEETGGTSGGSGLDDDGGCRIAAQPRPLGWALLMLGVLGLGTRRRRTR